MGTASFDETMDALGFEAQREAWRCWWPPLDHVKNAEDSWLFEAGRLDELCAWLSLDAEPAKVLKDGLREVLASRHVRVLLAQAIRMMGMAQAPPPSLPKVDAEKGAWARVFSGLVVLGCVPVTRRRHEERGVPESVTRATFNDFGRWMKTYREVNGRWGFAQSDWLFNHVSGRLVELGRLQFGRSACDLPYHVFCEKGKRGVVVMAADGCRIRPDGQFLTADKGIDRDGPHLVTRLDMREREVIGHRVDAHGAVEQVATVLPLSEWERVIEPGTPVLDVHIPGFSPLDDSACGECFSRAMEFFPRHYPEHRFAGLTCSSWLMDPQLAGCLKAESNIVKFLRRFRLMPAPLGWDFQHYERVFGGPVKDMKTAPRDNTLRRAILDHVEKGGRWRYGAGMILRRELEGG